MSIDAISGDFEQISGDWEFAKYQKPGDYYFEPSMTDTAAKTILVTANKGVGVSIEREWGGNEPPKTRATLHGYIEDQRGNRVNGSVSRNEDGRNRVSLSATYDDKRKPEPK